MKFRQIILLIRGIASLPSNGELSSRVLSRSRSALEQDTGARPFGAAQFAIMLLVNFIVSSNGHCYSVDVHELIVENAEKNSNTSNALKALGLNKGIDEIVKNRKVLAWMKEGGIKEDDVLFPIEGIRFMNHLYNPLSNSGLSDFPFYGVSSYEWASQLNNFWSWKWARDYF